MREVERVQPTPTQFIQPTPIQRASPGPPAPTQSTPARTTTVQPVPARTTPVQPAPMRPGPVQPVHKRATSIQPVPIRATPVQPVPIRATPIQPVHEWATPIRPHPPQEVQPMAAPVIPLVLPPAQIDQHLPRSSYPPAWQDLIDHACIYILHDMIFSHPFPSAAEGQKWAREALSAAFVSYKREYDITLDKKSCKSSHSSSTFQTYSRL